MDFLILGVPGQSMMCSVHTDYSEQEEYRSTCASCDCAASAHNRRRWALIIEQGYTWWRVSTLHLSKDKTFQITGGSKENLSSSRVNGKYVYEYLKAAQEHRECCRYVWSRAQRVLYIRMVKITGTNKGTAGVCPACQGVCPSPLAYRNNNQQSITTGGQTSLNIYPRIHQPRKISNSYSYI